MTPELGPSMFNPGLWSDKILETFKRATVFNDMGASLLSPSDMWNDRLYDEACAFAHVAGVTVVVPNNSRAGSFFRLSRSGCPPQNLAQCSPAELIDHVKAYAAKHNEPPEF